MTDFYCSTKTVRRELSLEEKLHILADAAKYDVSCTSSGSSGGEKRDIWAILSPPESAIVSLQTDAVSLC